METFFPKLKLREWGVVIGIIALFIGVATYNITKLPIFVDEALYLRWAQIAWHDPSWRFISLTDGKQPLYIWFVIPFMKLIADPLAAGRIASVVSGAMSVLGMGYLGWQVKDKKTGLWAMLFTMFSPYLFFYYRFGIMESTLIASIVWVTNLAVLLAKTKRLDVALILGMATGLSLLVKSSALFFCLLIPAAYVLTVDFKKIVSKETLRYGSLVGIAWVLAFVIYNIQRLSPWMHIISEKNAFFTVPYSQIFDEPARLINNVRDVWRWQLAYTTIPVVLASIAGLYLLLRREPRKFWLVAAWLFGPVAGTVAIARLFAPRYIIYATPFVLLSAAVAVGMIKKAKYAWGVSLLLLILPVSLIYRVITDPIHFPYVNVDEGYVNGWSAGNGTKQIAEWARMHANEVGGKEIVIFTEGTFGILPHGLELYAQGIPNVKIVGVYPLDAIPPTSVVGSARTNPETYLILNNTELATVPDGLELIASYPKLRDNPMRLYKVVAK